MRLSLKENSLLCGKWYHDFANLGFIADRYGQYHRLNQMAKQRRIQELIVCALQLCKDNRSTAPEGIELFCADGFYSNMAIKLGASKMLGVDLNEGEISKARLITRILGNGAKAEFQVGDVFALNESFDFGICAGGLYHLENPCRLL